MNNTVQPPVHILGAGVIGLSLAWELARRGFRVTVLDQGRIGGGASWAGAGILPAAPVKNIVDPYEQLKARSHELHPQWARQLTAETGIDTGFRPCGGIHLAMTEAEAATLAGNRYWWDEHGIDYRPVEKDELTSIEPALASVAQRMSGTAWLLPEEYQLRNPWHVRALAEACRRRGVELLPNTPVQRIEISGEQAVELVVQGETRLPCQRVCICTGAWARSLLNELGLSNGIMPIRGQMLLYHAEHPLLSHVINVGNRYLVPRDDGYCLAGSVEEEAGYRCETTPEAIAQLKSWAESVVPILQETKLERTWAGLRPGSFDGLPYMGDVPGISGVYVAAGHFRSGLHLSCATAEVMADVIEGKAPRIDLTPLRPTRG